jgi:hypothetical protein
VVERRWKELLGQPQRPECNRTLLEGFPWVFSSVFIVIPDLRDRDAVEARPRLDSYNAILLFAVLLRPASPRENRKYNVQGYVSPNGNALCTLRFLTCKFMFLRWKITFSNIKCSNSIYVQRYILNDSVWTHFLPPLLFHTRIVGFFISWIQNIFPLRGCWNIRDFRWGLIRRIALAYYKRTEYGRNVGPKFGRLDIDITSDLSLANCNVGSLFGRVFVLHQKRILCRSSVLRYPLLFRHTELRTETYIMGSSLPDIN